MRLQVGQRVLHFVLERKLGEGGFGEVWLAKAGMASTALKFVSVAGEDLEKGRKEYNRIRWGIEKGLFNHDRLIKMNGVWLLNDQMEDIPDAVLESAQGGRTMELKEAVVEPDTLLIQMDLGQESLASMLKRLRKDAREGEAKGLPIDRLLPFIWQAAEGIDFLNTPRIGYDGQPVAAVYHCDIKPENLLLMDDGKVKICDYGVARIEGKAKTRSPNALSLAHASPELVDDQPCAQSDQYSLAITYVQLRTGRLPFKPDVISGTWRTVMRAVARGDLELDVLTDSAERAVIKRATSLNPSKRYPTATDMAEALWRAVSPETVPTGRIPVRQKPWPWKGALAALTAVALIAFGISYLRRDGVTPVPVPIPASDAVKEKRDAWHVLVADSLDEPVKELRAFDALELAIRDVQGQFEESDRDDLKAVLVRLLDAAMTELNEPTLDAAQQTDLGNRVQLAQRYSSHAALTDAGNALRNRARLAVARWKLHQAWPQPTETPEKSFTLLDEDRSTLSASGGGLSETELNRLKELSALERWPGRAQTLNADAIQNLVPDLQAALDVKEPALAEKSRLAELKKKATADVTSLLDQNDEALPKELEPSIESLFDMDYFQLRLNSVIKALNGGHVEAAQTKLARLEADAHEPDEQHAVAWVKSLAQLYGPDALEAFPKLESELPQATPGEREMLVNVLSQRFVKAIASAEDWQRIDRAAQLAQKIDAAQTPSAPPVQAKLVAQRVATRLLLPESASNSWSQWSADVAAANELARVQKAALESEADWVGFPLLQLTQAELAAFAEPAAPGKLVEARAVLVKLKEQQQQAAAIDKQYPGYLAYVEALLAPTDRATVLADLFAGPTNSSSAISVVPALAWKMRRDAAGQILADAAMALRARPVEDVSLPPFSSTDMPVALRYLIAAEGLLPDEAPPQLKALQVLAQTSAASLAPAEVVKLVDPLLPAAVDQDGADAAPLFVASGLAHAQLATPQSGNAASPSPEARLAVERFARALKTYETWAADQPEDLSRDERLYDRILRPANSVARPFFKQTLDEVDAEMRTPLAQVCISSARLLSRLSIAGKLPPESDITDGVIAIWFQLGNDLTDMPQDAFVKSEIKWLMRLQELRSEHWTPDRKLRLMKLVDGIADSSSDVELQAIKGNVLHLQYLSETDPVKQKELLTKAIAAYTKAIGADRSAPEVHPQFLIERGGMNLQLAFVAHRNRALLGEDAASIRGYLEDASADAEAATRQPGCDLETAFNLWGNSQEDLAYYHVDVEGNKWREHYERAIEKFREAELVALNAGEERRPSFNAARCRFRMFRDAQIRNPADSDAAKAGLREAVNEARSAIDGWRGGDDVGKAEASFWLSESQEALNDFAAADVSRGEAVRIAKELDDPNWQVYQHRWAELAYKRMLKEQLKVPSPAQVAVVRKAITDARQAAQARAEELIAVARANPKRVGQVKLAAGVELLARMAELNVAIELVKDELDTRKSFAGDEPANRALRAQLMLAVAERVNDISPTAWQVPNGLKSRCIDRAKDVIDLANKEPKFPRGPEFVSRAHYILGMATLRDAVTGNTPERNVDLWRDCQTEFRLGAEAIPANAEISSLELDALLKNIVGFTTVTNKLKASNLEAENAKQASSNLLDGFLDVAAIPLSTAQPGEIFDRRPLDFWQDWVTRMQARPK